MELGQFSSVESAFHPVLASNYKPTSINGFLKILRGHFEGRTDWSLLRELLTKLGQPSVSPNSFERVAIQDRPFAESIAQLGRRSHAREDSPQFKVRKIGRELDFLERTCFLPNLTPIQLVHLLLFRSIPPTKSVAVVVTMRDEGPSLLEWIAFNRAIGLADIFVYSNDNVDGSDELLEVLALAGVIKLIKNTIGPGTNPQRKAYQHAVHMLRELRAYRWALFLDADEFLTPDEQYDYRLDNLIAHVEETFQEDLPGAVVFPWEWRFNHLKLERTDGLLFERYPHSTPHFQVKSLTHLRTALGMCEVHIPTLEPGARLVDSAFSPVDADFTWSVNLKSRAGGTISHFWGKSFEEFAVKKRRGELLSLGNDPYSREFKQYFEWTTNPTQENFHPAPEILLQRLHDSLSQLRTIPGVNAASDRIKAKYEELCRKIKAESNLREIFDQMRLSV